MTEWLVELYLPRRGLAATVTAARRVATELSAAGRPVRYVDAVALPDDESCFLLWEADDAQTVEEACHRAGIGSERIARAERAATSTEEGRR
jgi:hypothetical protein